MEPSGSAILLAKLRADLGLGYGCIDLASLQHHQIQIVSQACAFERVRVKRAKLGIANFDHRIVVILFQFAHGAR